MHASIVEELIDDEAFGVEAVPDAERFQRPRNRRIVLAAEPCVAAKQP